MPPIKGTLHFISVDLGYSWHGNGHDWEHNAVNYGWLCLGTLLASWAKFQAEYGD